MTPDTINTLCRWLTRRHLNHSFVSEWDLFTAAYCHKYGGRDADPASEAVQQYATTGMIPDYVKSFIKEVVYPTLVAKAEQPILPAPK